MSYHCDISSSFLFFVNVLVYRNDTLFRRIVITVSNAQSHGKHAS